MIIARVSKEGIDLASNMKMLIKGYPFMLVLCSNIKRSVAAPTITEPAPFNLL